MAHGQKPTTNEFYRSVLDNAIRERLTVGQPRVERAKQEKSRRLSSLYGYNSSSSMVKSRMGRAASRQRKSTSARSAMREASAMSMALEQDDFQPLKSAGLLDMSTAEASLLEESGLLHTLEEADSCSVASELLHNTLEDPSDVLGVDPAYELEGATAKPRRRRKKPRRKDNNGTAPLGSRSAQQHSLSANSMMQVKVRPWYAGHQNSAEMLPSARLSAARRYGYVGTLNLHRNNMVSLKSRSVDLLQTNLTLPNALPKFLGEASIVDEYVPNLRGQPGAWPHAASYVTGSKLKTEAPVPELTPHLVDYLKRQEGEVLEYNVALVAERAQDHQQRSVFVNARPRLAVDASSGRPLNEHNSLIRASRRLKFGSSVTLLTESKTDEELLGETVMRRAQHHEAMVDLRWAGSAYLCRLLRGLSVQLRPGLEELRALLSELQYAVRHGSAKQTQGARLASSAASAADDCHGLLNEASLSEPRRRDSKVDEVTAEEEEEREEEGGDTAWVTPGDDDVRGDDDEDAALRAQQEEDPSVVYIGREVFVNVMCSYFEQADRRKLNKLFSGFDPDRVDQVDYRLVMATQRCLWRHSQESSAEKLCALFDIMDTHYKDGVLPAHDVACVLQVCSTSDDERQAVLAAMNAVLALSVAEHTLLSSPGFLHAEEFARALDLLPKKGGPNPLLRVFGEQCSARLERFLTSSSSSSPAGPPAAAAADAGSPPPASVASVPVGPDAHKESPSSS